MIWVRTIWLQSIVFLNDSEAIPGSPHGGFAVLNRDADLRTRLVNGTIEKCQKH